MKIIDADHDRRYDIPGVPGPARKPVDIDASKTEFTRLRSLRLYRFDAGSVIDGHAEDDEVFVVITAGSVEMKIGFEDSGVDAAGTYTLAAPDGTAETPFVAYLPPHSMYQLTPRTAADVAYARATPSQPPRSPAVFASSARSAPDDHIVTLLREDAHAERLRLRVVQVHPRDEEASIDFPCDTETSLETLVHVQGSPAEALASIFCENGTSTQLRSWQTAAFAAGEPFRLHIAREADARLLIVSAL